MICDDVYQFILKVYTFNGSEVKQYWYKIEDILEGKVNNLGFYKF